MNDELDEFTAQLNSAGEEKPKAAPAGAKGPGGAPPNMTPQSADGPIEGSQGDARKNGC